MHHATFVFLGFLLLACDVPVFDAPCESPSDCTLAIDQCCACGAGVDAVVVSRVRAHRDHVCGASGPIVCDECAGPLRPSLGATCRAGVCEVYDLYDPGSSVAACTSDEDCVVRASACCTCGADTSSLVAIAREREADYRALVCPPDAACDACEPVYPDGVRAVCSAAGHCVIEP
ncbi:MAG: hypothetical protein H6721_04155 [Sandaracinus sp.]|nr:hypothetical protein [Myxococcales bacterium]MCB9600740.1 hypothetical protein [Sandaracinus sp.]MCB9624283.1 hypothetical protein [Sandaracinus sp.]MCB9631317.1 hypothetical protein [Sandaracinus sp.]